ncbi:MAG TPA: acyl carrier protein [Gammaproteobacteria bacterium]|jgi:acyl carrier protein|nr:acyl carrier protein [Gammaproteobacteria bacterium]
MTAPSDDSLRATVLDALVAVAPDVDPGTLDPAVPFRDQFDFDSMDHLNFVIGLHRALGVDVPETDYPQLASLDGCVRYLARALGAQAAP